MTREASEAAVDAAAALFGVELRPDWREAAVAQFGVLQAAAALVAGLPLDDEAEYGPVFSA